MLGDYIFADSVTKGTSSSGEGVLLTPRLSATKGMTYGIEQVKIRTEEFQELGGVSSEAGIF